MQLLRVRVVLVLVELPVSAEHLLLQFESDLVLHQLAGAIPFSIRLLLRQLPLDVLDFRQVLREPPDAVLVPRVRHLCNPKNFFSDFLLGAWQTQSGDCINRKHTKMRGCNAYISALTDRLHEG